MRGKKEQKREKLEWRKETDEKGRQNDRRRNKNSAAEPHWFLCSI